MFRLIRSFTSTYSTVANCSVKEAISRISKIQLQNDIMNATSPQYVYPRLNKKTAFDNENNPDLPTKDEMIEMIEQCQRYAIRTARTFDMISRRPLNIYTCGIIPHNTQKYVNIKRRKILKTTGKFFPLPTLANLQLKDYTEKSANLDVDCTNPYVEITRDDGRKIIVKKTSLCWALRSDRHKLSSDRLERVKYQACTTQLYPMRKQAKKRGHTNKRFLHYSFKTAIQKKNLRK